MRFGTLNEALDSIDCVQHWPFGLNVGYDEDARVYYKKNSKHHVIIVNRDDSGYYEILTYCTE